MLDRHNYRHNYIKKFQQFFLVETMAEADSANLSVLETSFSFFSSFSCLHPPLHSAL